MKYKNGNADIEISSDGTRTITWKGKNLDLEFPLNIDIKVTNKCAFGYNPNTGKTFCSFCHESARTDGKECDYEKLKEKLTSLPKGVELAIGGNEITDNLISFFYWTKEKGYICNLTVNQGHVNRDYYKLMYLITEGLISGLGVSYRPTLRWNIPDRILNYRNTVFHVIAGIDGVDYVKALSSKGVRKILVLGEKDFGFNEGKVNLQSDSHKKWYSEVESLFQQFEIVSFDNLAIEQLQLKRFFLKRDWELFYQGERSIYIDAVAQMFAPSSRSKDKVSWEQFSVQKYFSRKNLLLK